MENVSLAIAQFNGNVSNEVIVNGTYTLDMFSKNMSSYYIQSRELVCSFWDEDEEYWSTEGFMVRVYSNISTNLLYI